MVGAASVYQVTAGEQILTVTLRREGEHMFARVGEGPEQRVKLDVGHGTEHVLTLGDRSQVLLARRSGVGVEVAIEGFRYQVEVLDELRARLARLAGTGRGHHARRELKAPMPGLVLSVNCAPGERVARGQPLVVLQAMKMENELGVPQDGTVQSVLVQSGQTVEQGQTLLVVE